MQSITEDIFNTLALTPTDIGGTDATSAYYDLKNTKRLAFVVGCGAAWNAGDSILTITILQAKNTSADSAKTLKVITLADNLVNTAGQSVAIEVDAALLDHDNGFDCVACKVAMTDNGGPDFVYVLALLGQARYAKINSDLYTLEVPKTQAFN